jgi:hypothetical protein
MGREEMKGGANCSGTTFRAFVIGGLLSFFIGVAAPYGNMIIRGSYMALNISTPIAFFLFFLLVGVVNAVMRLVWAHAALRPGELVTIYIMMIIAATVPTKGFTEAWLAKIVGPYYYATPENQWDMWVLPHIREWLVPQDQAAIRYFFEGLPAGMAIPWGAWIAPVIYWSALFIALCFVMLCISVILHRQWAHNERLIYPLIQVPLDMVREDENGSAANPFFKSIAMWIGFAIPVLVTSVNGLRSYYPAIPAIELSTALSAFRETISIPVHMSFSMVGFSYLINLDIALGIWFFYLLVTVEEGVFNILGIFSTETLDMYGAASPIIAHQGMGAAIVLVLSSMWIARRHLADVVRKAYTGDSRIDDSGEMLSYRTAVLGLLGGFAFMAIWLQRAGLPAWLVPLFLLAVFALFTALTRVVAEAGLAAVRAPLTPVSFLVSGVGSSAIGASGMVLLGLSFSWAVNFRTFVLASAANGLKLSDEVGMARKRPLFWAMMLALTLSLIGSIWIILRLAYTHGGINLNQWFFIGGANTPFQFVAPHITSPLEASASGWIWTGVGAGIMGLLMLARQQLLWWPVHPLGFFISTTWMAQFVWFSVFLAWLIKFVVLRYGGPRLYRVSRPFFLGLILGHFTVAGAWLVVDYFTGMTDNSLMWL